MTFDEWWESIRPIPTKWQQSPGLIAEAAWNAAIEQAAQVAENYKIHPHESTMAGVNIAEYIRRDNA